MKRKPSPRIGELLTCALALLLAAPAIAQADAAEDAPADLLMQQVLEAEQSFEQSVAAVKKELAVDIKRAIDRAIDRAADDGDLDEMERLQSELKAYEENGTIPADKVAQQYAEQYGKKLVRLGDALIRTYEGALKRYTRQREIENARLMQDKILWTRPATNLDTTEHKGHLYLLVLERTGWNDAKAACEELGGYLACLNNEAENRFIIKELVGKKQVLTWVGASDAESEGDWKWLDRSDDYWPWAPREPNNTNNAEHFAFLGPKGRLNDAWEREQYVTAYLCEWDHVPTRETIYQPEQAED